MIFLKLTSYEYERLREAYLPGMGRRGGGGGGRWAGWRELLTRMLVVGAPPKPANSDQFEISKGNFLYHVSD